MRQIPRYMQLIANGTVEIPARTFALSSIEQAWNAPAADVRRTVIIPA
jgi:hypothetical protein